MTTTEADRYERVVDAVMEHYTAGRFADALALVERDRAALPTYRSDVAHLAACLRARSGDPQGGLVELQSALADGGWWSRDILEDDDDLAPVRALPGYPEVLAESTRRWSACRESYAASPPLVRRPTGAPVGVVVALHGAAQDANRAATDWSVAVEEGWLLVTLDSSQRSTPTYRTWPEQDLAAKDVADALAQLSDEERALPVVAGGFSAGGRAALLWAVSGNPCPVSGVVAVGPAIEAEQIGGGDADLRGVIVMGRKDDLADGARAAATRLPGVRLDVIDGLGHAYPDDFADRLAAALKDLSRGSS